MNRLFLISGIAVFVAAIFLIVSIPNTTMAYSCSSSSSTHNVNLQSSLTGSSGGCATSSSAATTSSNIGRVDTGATGPNNTIGLGFGSTGGHTISGPGHIHVDVTIFNPKGGAVTSASSGGSQTSCSSSSATSFGSIPPNPSGVTTTSSSQSQPGSCP